MRQPQKNINKIIELIPPAYRMGHTQSNMMKMYPSSSYTISFRDNKALAEDFRLKLFDNMEIYQI